MGYVVRIEVEPDGAEDRPVAAPERIAAAIDLLPDVLGQIVADVSAREVSVTFMVPTAHDPAMALDLGASTVRRSLEAACGVGEPSWAEVG